MLASTNQTKGFDKFLSHQLNSDQLKQIRGGSGNNNNDIVEETQIVVDDIVDG